MLDLDPEDRQSIADQAFRRSESYTFQGKPLEPYSFTRQTAAAKLGLVHGNAEPTGISEILNDRKDLLTNGAKLTPEERAEIEKEPASVRVYAELARDIAIVLWLCHQPIDVVKAARLHPARYEDAIDEWADAHRLGVAGPERKEALTIFAQIAADISDSRGEPDFSEQAKTKKKKATDPKNAEAPPATPSI